MTVEHSGQPRTSDRALAEAVRFYERDGLAPLDEPAAEQAARAAGGDLESRVVRRAATLRIAPDLEEALGTLRSIATWVVLVAVVLAALTGAGAARAALGAPGGASVNVFLLLAGLLGAQTLLLGLWILLMLVRFDAVRVSPLGSALFGLARWLVVKGTEGERSVATAAVRAVAGMVVRGPTGRWTLSAISHAVWSGANVGVIAILIVLLSTKQYVFHWETTILSADAYGKITSLLATVPAACGFAVPTPEEVAATEGVGGTLAATAARSWSGLLVGAIVVYGLLPRALLLLVALVMRARALARRRLDLSAPGYARLASRLMPSRRAVVDGDDEAPVPSPHATGVAVPPPGTGPPVIVALETERPAGPWPPRLHAVRWHDLGIVDGREDRDRVEEELSALSERPMKVVVVCSLTNTPDRGLGAFFERLTGREDAAPVAALLTGGDTLRQRTDAEGVARRVEDWRDLARACGVAEVIEIDLDHLTETGTSALAALVGAAAPDRAGDVAQGERGLAAAFDGIAAAAHDWPDPPPPTRAAELYRDIARMYQAPGGGHGGVRVSRLRLPTGLDGEDLRSGAKRVVDLLPSGLRANPKWLAAGAVGGALACVGSALLLSPVAISALPLWTGIGAAVTGILSPGGRRDDEADAADSAGDKTTLLRGAVLHALLLASQAFDEAAITRILDRTIAGAGDGPRDMTQWPAWLDEVRHHHDLACARETAA